MNTDERRSKRIDRRQRDMGPPCKCAERRKHAERRLPMAEETQISIDEFEQYFGSTGKSSNVSNHFLDQAAEVFDRVRDGY